MAELKKTNRFNQTRKKFIKNNIVLAEKVIKTFTILTNNPHHPSLHLEKLKGSDLWTVRIDKENRIFFAWMDDQTIFLLDIGKHDKYRKY